MTPNLITQITQVVLSVAIVAVYLLDLAHGQAIDPTLQNIVLGLLAYWFGTGAVTTFAKSRETIAQINASSAERLAGIKDILKGS